MPRKRGEEMFSMPGWCFVLLSLALLMLPRNVWIRSVGILVCVSVYVVSSLELPFLPFWARPIAVCVVGGLACAPFFVALGMTVLVRRSARVPVGIAFPVSWVAIEALAALSGWNACVPSLQTLHVAAEQIQWGAIAQVADVSGASTIVFVVAAAAGSVVDIFLVISGREGVGRGALSAGFASLLLLISVVYGCVRPCQDPHRPTLGVRIETSGPTRWSGARPPGHWLVVYPEGALSHADLGPLKVADSSSARGYCIGGVDWMEGNSLRNSAILMSAAGEPLARHDKAYLVPLVEYNPARRFFNAKTRDYTPGTIDSRPWLLTTPLVNEPLLRVSPVLCYEMMFPVKIEAHRDPYLLVHLGNLSSLIGTSYPEWDLAVDRLRAIELRCPVLKAARHGYSGVIDEWGVFYGCQGPSLGDPREAQVPIVRRSSAYRRFGDWLSNACLAIALLFAVGLALPRNRARVGQAAPRRIEDGAGACDSFTGDV